ncbi:hypothetical protein PENTCL1PPCAC_13110, partial [Pristionchus entomophagus]
VMSHPTVLLVSLLAVCALGCIPMTPTTPGIPAIAACKKCDSSSPLQLDSAGGTWGTPAIDNSGPCAVVSVACGSYLDAYEGSTGSGQGSLMLKCTSDSVWGRPTTGAPFISAACRS